jgi:ankyrin repeat protein
MSILKELAQKNRSELFKKDRNGWRPLHEAARGGKHEVVEFLLKEGAQINERTNDNVGGSPLWWAERKPEQNKLNNQNIK